MTFLVHWCGRIVFHRPRRLVVRFGESVVVDDMEVGPRKLNQVKAPVYCNAWAASKPCNDNLTALVPPRMLVTWQQTLFQTARPTRAKLANNASISFSSNWNLVESRELARRLIMAGDVLIDEQVSDKPGKSCAGRCDHPCAPFAPIREPRRSQAGWSAGRFWTGRDRSYGC